MKGLIHLRGFEGRSAFSTWLTRIAINGALMMRRKRGSRFDRSIESMGESGSLGEVNLADRTPSAEVQMDLYETNRQIHRAIQRLPWTLRGPLGLQISEDLPVKELANRLGISVPATKSRLMRARMLVSRSVKKSQGRTSVISSCETSPEGIIGTR
jgi:RNA polymerase sigma-70 factor (ECF subfamily)